jgi:voltage-gated potassium channel
LDKRKRRKFREIKEALNEAYNEFEESGWVETSLAESRITLRSKFELFWSQSSFSIVWNFYQVFLTIVSCYAYVHELYEEPVVHPQFIALEAFLAINFFLDFLGSFYAAFDKLDYVLSFFSVIDWLTTVPFFIAWGFGNPLNDGTQDNQLLFVRSLRLFRSFRAIRFYRFIPLKEGSQELTRKIVQVVVALFILMFVSTSCMQFIEDNLDPIPGLGTNAPFPWHTALYYMVVSLTTVGYGDITPKTEVGRGVIMIFLIWSVTLIPYFFGSLMSVIKSINKYDGTAYTDTGHYQHIILLGDFSGKDLKLFLAEWYHKENSNANTRVVIVSPSNPSEEMAKTLKLRYYINTYLKIHNEIQSKSVFSMYNSKYENQVIYIRGSPLDEDVFLKCAKAALAVGFFLFVSDVSDAIFM